MQVRPPPVNGLYVAFAVRPRLPPVPAAGRKRRRTDRTGRYNMHARRSPRGWVDGLYDDEEMGRVYGCVCL
eukprot:CAMPEP_0119533436 /NCGR_PEP_ID=MMETSP1344-20130328/46832_1 /TAXON_ID=236787 /ORGANISM="Florenciella parvula, Strain CCMP2471" /LENGTH=70 /DNA_ID=CAMNT_0007574321 /DNA_START=460 /DNA_END=672 /DNA_ORIENTATION=-